MRRWNVRRWVARARALLRRLPFVPLTLLHTLLNAGLRTLELRRGRAVTRAAQVPDDCAALPLSTMLWLDRVAAEVRTGPFDVCLRLPRDGAGADLHDVFSVLLTSPRLGSIGFYWDDAALADDGPLWSHDPPVHDTLRGASVDRLERFLLGEHERLELPVAARREAHTLLKRQAGAAYAVCLNVPDAQPVAAVAAAEPAVRFFDLRDSGAAPANVTSLTAYGLSLHERMALVQAADAYVGRFDELGCAALAGGRPAVLVGGAATGDSDASTAIGGAAPAVWFPSPPAPTVAMAAIEFLRRRRATLDDELRRIHGGHLNVQSAAEGYKAAL